jgi:hypothetical protein
VKYSVAMSELTFRDFAGNLMRGDAAAAATVLETLLGLPPAHAATATEHFRSRMADPVFMPKAMGLRNAVTSGSDGEIRALLGDCFGLDEAGQQTGLAALRTKAPAP